jgi:rhamnosyltransferase
VSNKLFDPSTAQVPHVHILLATHNGSQWLDEQIESIFRQRGVRVSIVVSDDRSNDSTLSSLSYWARRLPITFLPKQAEPFGSAHRNFIRLIRDTDLGDADFFALSDQDDIWLPDKLSRGIECLRLHNAQGYSSNVIAFWPDGSQRSINKAQSLQPLDYLFGSPGPGCTFVLPRSVFSKLQAFVAGCFLQLQSIWVHDWLIYAFVRSRGGRWFIDLKTNMLYRQHSRNEIGINSGWRAAVYRLKRVRSGAYRKDILTIADSIGERNALIEALRRLHLIDRLALIMNVRLFRRRISESVALAFFILLMPRD